MNSNHHQSETSTPETRSSSWMLVVGVIALILATVCLDAAVVGLAGAAQLLTEPTVQPAELASRIRLPLVFSIAMLPLGYLGVVLLVLGFTNRQPVTST